MIDLTLIGTQSPRQIQIANKTVPRNKYHLTDKNRMIWLPLTVFKLARNGNTGKKGKLFPDKSGRLVQ